jgi:hypothetical protein
MLLDVPIEEILNDLYGELRYPFPYPWEEYPLVPDMNVVVDYVLNKHHAALVPFERNPVCTPSADCPGVPVWEDGEAKFRDQLRYGPGLLECERRDGFGHMCAWDGLNVYDPEGYKYWFEALAPYGLEARRFWLCT